MIFEALRGVEQQWNSGNICWRWQYENRSPMQAPLCGVAAVL